MVRGADLDVVALSVESAPGVFALLLGSGVSRDAGIPTASAVVDDLIARCAIAAGETPPADPRAWYAARFDEPVGYSRVMGRLGPTPAARRELLRGYIEPDEDERAQGRKTPTRAHVAIARLVASGHIRVVVTTNFDRLLEAALADQGVAPSVIASPDDAEGAVPLAHAPCTVIKLHGDYLDARIRNTDDELEAYPPALASLMRRVVDEYGLIVCGWSGEWDTALRDLIASVPNRRYPMYWAARREPEGVAQTLVANRGAQVVTIGSADMFFDGLAERVSALAARGGSADLSARVVRDRTKRYVTDPQATWRMSDLVDEVLARAMDGLGTTLPSGGVHPDTLGLTDIERIEGSVKPLLAMLAHGAYWGGEGRLDLWRRCLLVLFGLSEYNGYGETLSLRRFPAELALYAAGTAALAARSDRVVAGLIATRLRTLNEQEPASSVLVANLAGALAQRVRNAALANAEPKKYRTPGSDQLHSMLREEMRHYVPVDKDWDDLFDYFDCLMVLHVLVERERRGFSYIASYTRFFWASWPTTRAAVKADADRWVAAGLFTSTAELETALQRLQRPAGWGWD